MLTFSVTLICLLVTAQCLPVPEQVHIALGDEKDSMGVHWLTFEDADSEVIYGTNKDDLNQKSIGETHNFTFGLTRFIHNAVMTNLRPKTTYYYKVGSNDSWSRLFTFKTLTDDPDYSFRICIFGDLGVENGISLEYIAEAVNNDEFDLMIDVGDFAYDLHTDDGRVGDIFMNQMEPIASRIPFMVVAGNHEDDGRNFSHYVNRFNMPNDPFGDSQAYSFDVGPIHFVAISTEYYGFFYEYGPQSVYTQYNWLKKHLEDYQKVRKQRPWLVTFQHRPFYCSNANNFECHSFENTLITKGYQDMPGLEKLYIDNGVDLSFWGHQHSYERFFPISYRKVYNLTADPYYNAPAPTYVISGAAGCHTKHAYFDQNPIPGSAARFVDYGYSVLHVHNKTHLYMQQISVERQKKVIDEFWLKKDLNVWPSMERAQNHMAIEFPPYIEPTTCNVRDPRCRFSRKRRNLFNKP
uniref:Purple acid phosphatase n=1 Tax=Bursaphelenchus xylophilus TaxID=6326 RepID=A0A1I7S5Z0_BURXY